MRTLSFNSGHGIPLTVKLTTFLLWALAIGVVVFWWLRWLGGSQGQELAPTPVAAVQANAQAMAKALGAVASAAAPVVAAPVSNRYVLTGVLAGHSSGAGAAVIAVGNNPAKAFKVGDALEDGVLLQSLSTREARLGHSMDGPATAVLELPKPAIAAFN